MSAVDVSPCRALRHGHLPTHIVQVGELARLALTRSGGVAQPLDSFPNASYLDAAGEIIWVGPQLPALQPRAVLTSVAQPRGIALHFETLPTVGWLPTLPHLHQAAANKLVASALRFGHILATEKSPRGFGPLLSGHTPEFPLSIATPRVHRLAAAYANDDTDSVIEVTRALLGFGTGLTPSGDDLTGAALFGRRFVAPHRPEWAAAAKTLSCEVETRSHAISAALFRDLARCASFAPLHAFAVALSNEDFEGAMRAARTLTSIGHSSGWDMMTGIMIGITGNLS